MCVCVANVSCAASYGNMSRTTENYETTTTVWSNSTLINVTLDPADDDDGSYPDFSQIDAVCATFIVLYLLVMVIALFGNAAVCYTVLSNRKMQSVVNFYIVNLAVCDFLIGKHKISCAQRRNQFTCSQDRS